MDILETTINPQILVLILLANFLIYVGGVWIKFGVQKSISDSYYSWKSPWGILFTFFCWILAFPMVMMVENFPENYQFLQFFAGAGYGFVGAASMIKQLNVRKVHYPAAIIAMSGGLLAIALSWGGWYIVTAVLGTAIAGWIGFFTKGKDRVWWAELVVFAATIGAYFARFFF